MLASVSPRRKRILEEAGFDIEVRLPKVDEIEDGQPEDIVIRNARCKALSVHSYDGEMIIGADTIVCCSGKILGKPRDRSDAKRMLQLELGSPQKIMTGTCLYSTDDDRVLTGYESSEVVMKGPPEVIDEYLDSGLWRGKAGGFGIQDGGPLLAETVVGEVDNVVGFPMVLFRRLLAVLR